MQRETGFTHKYLLWGEPWCLLNIKTADAPTYKSKKNANSTTVATGDKEEDVDKKLMDFFRENE